MLTVGRKGETIRLVEQTPTSLGQTLMLDHDGKSHRLALPLIGAYQAANVLTAAGLVLATGGDWATTFSAMQRVAPVRGRLERAVSAAAACPSISITRTRPMRWKRRSPRFARMWRDG